MASPVVVCSDDVDVFLSIEEAERYLEEPDVKDSAFRCYDVRGGRLWPKIDGGFWRSRVYLLTTGEGDSPMEAKSAQARSQTGIPVLAGGPPLSPVMDMIPLMAWAMMSNPGSREYGPSRPQPDTDT